MIPSPQLTFIIPVHNEEFNIRGVFRDLYAVLEKHPKWKWEVIVIKGGGGTIPAKSCSNYT